MTQHFPRYVGGGDLWTEPDPPETPRWIVVAARVLIVVLIVGAIALGWSIL